MPETTILDRYGNPYRLTKKPDTRQIAVSMVRDKYSSYPSKGLTPTRLATIFKEADQGDVFRQAELFEEMEEKDTHLGSVLQTRKLAVTGLDFEILPAGDDKKAKDYATFIEEKIRYFDDWNDLLLDSLDAIGKGISVVELYWEVKNGEAIVTGHEWIHQKNLTFIDKNKLLKTPRLITENEPVLGEDLQPFKFILHRYKARSGHASRQGLLRVCAWMYLFKNYDLKDWVAFAEIFGTPLRLGRYDPNASQDDIDTLIEAVTQLGADAAAVISKSTEIEAIKNDVKGSSDLYNKLADYCDKQMSKAVLGQTASTDETPGKLGAAPEKDAVRQDLLEADSKAIQKTIKRDLFRPLIGFNYGWENIEYTPFLKLTYEPPEDRKAEAETYKTVVKDIGLPVSKQHLYNKFGIPKPEEGEETIGGDSPQNGNPEQNKLQQLVNKFNLTDDSLKQENLQNTIDQFVDEALSESSGNYKELLNPVMDLIANASTLNEIQEKLVAVYPEMDTGDLEDLIGKAIFLSELIGRASIIGTDHD